MNEVVKLEGEERGEGHFGAADSAPPIRRWTTRRRAVSSFFFSSYEENAIKQAIL